MPPDDPHGIFAADVMTKRQRVEATLGLKPVDRAAILEQLSYNPRVIERYTGRPINGFDYTLDDICQVIRATADMTMPPTAPRGKGRVVSSDGFVFEKDEWTTWHVSRPFTDEQGACAWLRGQIAELDRGLAEFDPDKARAAYRHEMLSLQARIGQTVILKYSATAFCFVFDRMGLEIHTFFCQEYPQVLAEFLEAFAALELQRVAAVADPELSPVILIPEDFATRQGPIFGPEFLQRFHYPFVRRLTDAWHHQGVKVLYHSDGNYLKAIPDLMACGVDGFYCLEPNCGMDIIALKNRWPKMVWAGGVDGVDLMERGHPAQVRAEVQRHIRQTRTLETGGMFVATSSEINPPIPAENYQALVEAVGTLRHPDFAGERASGPRTRERSC